MSGTSGTKVAGWILVGSVVVFLLGVAVAALPALPLLGITQSWPRAVLGLLVGAGGTLMALGALLGLVGLALYVLVPAFSGRDLAMQDYGSHRVVLACTVLAAVIGNLLAALYFVPVVLLALFGGRSGGGADLAGRLLSPQGIAVAALSLDVSLLGVVYLRIVRPGALSWRAMGLDTKQLGSRLLLGMGLGLLLFGVSSLMEMLMSQLGVHQTQQALFQSVTRASFGEFGLVLLAGAVVAPLVEEIFFRGYVFRAYLDQKGLWQAFFFSSALFALVHLDLPALLPIFAMGLLLSLVYYRTGSIIPGIVAHAVNNAVAFTLLFLGLA